MRLAMTLHGVSKSESEMAQKSWPSGAPTSEPHELSAVMPGMMRSSGDSPRFHPISSSTWKTRLAIPYTPASPDEMIATLPPSRARSTAARARPISSVMPVFTTSFPSMRWRTSLMYVT
jgi:hypothetical protein